MRNFCVMLLCLSIASSARANEPDLLGNAVKSLINTTSDYVGFSAKERETNRQILAICKQFLHEDGHDDWNITEPRGYEETTYFDFKDPESKRFIGLSVQIINMAKHKERYPLQTLEAVWQQQQKNGRTPLIPEKSHFNVIESGTNYMVYEWVFIGDEKRNASPRHKLTRFEIKDGNLILKTYLNEEGSLSKEEIALWRERFKKIPAY